MKQVTIPIVKDALDEKPENFTVRLTDPENLESTSPVKIGKIDAATITIYDRPDGEHDIYRK